MAATIDAAVRDFRATVLLLADEPDPADGVTTAAWLFYQRNEDRLADLTAHLLTTIASQNG